MHHAGVGVTFVFPPFGLITKHQQLGLSTRAFTCVTVTPKLTLFLFLTYLIFVTHSKKNSIAIERRRWAYARLGK